MNSHEETQELMHYLQERVRKGERGVLGEAGGFLFYGEEQPSGGSGRLAGYRVAKVPFLDGTPQVAREALLTSIPLPVLETAAYLEVLASPIPEEQETIQNFSSQLARKAGDHGPTLVVKDRGGVSPRFTPGWKRGTKSHEELARDRATLLKQ